MNNKGFTLIELIMVIMIIAMLGLFAAPNVIKMINKNKVDNYNSTIDSIIKAAELYTLDKKYEFTFGGHNCMETSNPETITENITLAKLVENGNIKSPVHNFCTNEDFEETTRIKIILNCQNKNFSYEIIDTKKETNVTENNGKIKEGKTCLDLY